MLGSQLFEPRHGAKIAIMSDKAQTTRNKIMGIYTTDKEQIVFIDTPRDSQTQDSAWRLHGGVGL